MSVAPDRFSCWLVLQTVRALPRPVRARYHAEFLADLYGLRRRRQLREAISLFVHWYVLRTSVTPSTDEETAMTAMTPAHKPLLCYLHHHLRTVVTDEGTAIRVCTRCGEEHYDGIGNNNVAGANIGNWIAGPSPM